MGHLALWVALTVLLLAGPVHAATIVVSTGADPLVNGDNFQTALTNAQCGDTIVVQAGAAYATRVQFTNSYGPQGSPFTAPNKSCGTGQLVTIQTSAVNSLPAGRVSYADIPNMATLATNTNAAAITYAIGAGSYKWIGILFTNTANVPANAGFIPNLVDTAQGGFYGMSGWPHDVTYDRIVIRPYEESLTPIPNTVRSAAFGLRLDGANMTLQNSYVAGFCCKQTNDGVTNTQSEAVAIVGGPGPYTMTNNFLEAYGWNIFTGGGGGQPQNLATLSAATYTSATLSNVTNLHVGDAIRFRYGAGFPSATCPNPGTNTITYGSGVVDSISGTTITWHWLSPGTPPANVPPDVPGEAAWNGVNPANFTVTRNTLNKRAEWTTNSGQCKSFWEMKAASNVLFEGNTLIGPIDGVSGAACPINSAFATNQDGSNPWAASNNNVLRSNLMIGVGAIFANMPYDTYCPALPGTGMTFTNNLLGFVGGTRFAFWLNTLHGSTWTITHNTVRVNTNAIFHPSCAAADTSCVTRSVTFRDNIVNSGSYFIQTLDQSPNQYPLMVQDHNVIINDTAPSPPPAYTSTDFIAASAAAVGFVNVTSADAGGDYHGYALAATSPYKGRASDSTDPGVNFAALDAAIGGGGVPPSTPMNLLIVP